MPILGEDDKGCLFSAPIPAKKEDAEGASEAYGVFGEGYGIDGDDDIVIGEDVEESLFHSGIVFGLPVFVFDALGVGFGFG